MPIARLVGLTPGLHLVTEQENYIIGEMDIMNHQLESEYGCLLLLRRGLFCQSSSRLTSNVVRVGVATDPVGETERVNERLEPTTNKPTTDRQHFWLSGYNVCTLATLKDRVWHSILLVEMCRSMLSRINEVEFGTVNL